MLCTKSARRFTFEHKHPWRQESTKSLLWRPFDRLLSTNHFSSSSLACWSQRWAHLHLYVKFVVTLGQITLHHTFCLAWSSQVARQGYPRQTHRSYTWKNKCRLLLNHCWFLIETRPLTKHALCGSIRTLWSSWDDNGGYLTKFYVEAPRFNLLPFYISFWQKRYRLGLPFIKTSLHTYFRTLHPLSKPIFMDGSDTEQKV